MTTRQWIAFLSLALIWGASFMWIKIALRETGPFTIVAIRIAFALIALLPFVIRSRTGFPRTLQTWRHLLILCLTSAVVPWLLIIWGEKHIDSAMATVLNASVPLFTIVIADRWLHDDRMTRPRVLGLLVGFVGIVVLVQKHLFSAAATGMDVDTKHKLLGQGASLTAAALYAFSNVYARARFRESRPIYQAFYSMVIASVMMWTITPIIEPPFTLPVVPATWVAIAWLGVLGAGISYLVFYWLLHQIGPTRVATVTYTIPLVGVTLGVVFLGEALTWELVAGTLLIVSGVWGVTRR